MKRRRNKQETWSRELCQYLREARYRWGRWGRPRGFTRTPMGGNEIVVHRVIVVGIMLTNTRTRSVGCGVIHGAPIEGSVKRQRVWCKVCYRPRVITIMTGISFLFFFFLFRLVLNEIETENNRNQEKKQLTFVISLKSVVKDFEVSHIKYIKIHLRWRRETEIAQIKAWLRYRQMQTI
jgi:hypothetical protein